MSFHWEVDFLKRIRHPNIITLIDIFLSPATANIYIVLEYADARNLADYVEENHPIEERTILLIFREICKAIEFLHN